MKLDPRMATKLVDIGKRTAIKSFVKLRKTSPEIALGAGIVCGIGAIVAAVMVSSKVEAVIDETQAKIEEIKAPIIESKKEDVELPVEERKDISRKVWRERNKMLWKLARILAPAVGLEVASIVLILLSHGILKKRYLNTTTALAALNEAFNAYRGRVRESVGEEAEKIIMSGGKVEKNIKVEDDDGNVSELPGQNIVINDHKNSPYEFDFNRHTAPLTWSPNPDYSETFLRNIQNYFNDLLQTRGHVFLNEILDQLGMKRTPAGQVCGWIKGAGDDYIDFGYMDSFMRDYKIDSDLCKKNIHLNFNVDGPIWNML